MTLGEVIAEVLQVFTSMIPRFHERPKRNQNAVYDLFLFGEQVVNWRPVLYAPVCDSVESWPRHRQVSSAESTIHTEEYGSTRIGAEFFYQVDDPIRCRAVWGEEHDSHLQAVVRGALVDSYDDIAAAVELCQKEFGEGGCTLLGIKIEDFCATIPVRHFQD